MASTRSRKAIERIIMKLLESRHPKTACPSEIARLAAPDDWRLWMPAVREAALALERRGRIDVTQRGKRVDPTTARGPIRLRLARAVQVYRRRDFREQPQYYRVGRGEQGVLTAGPYKSELLPLWRFKTPSEARKSARALLQAFAAYGKADDFVGQDMARKFLQMGFTRARRYANHRSGRKYDEQGRVRASDPDPEKARAAEIFKRAWDRVEGDPSYRRARQQHVAQYG